MVGGATEGTNLYGKNSVDSIGHSVGQQFRGSFSGTQFRVSICLHAVLYLSFVSCVCRKVEKNWATEEFLTWKNYSFQNFAKKVDFFDRWDFFFYKRNGLERQIS